MNGKELLQRLKTLSQIEDPKKDIHSLTFAQFPGTHCPLMGAAMAIRGIKNAWMMIVGTDECAYYTKHMTIHSDDWGGLQGRCVSVVIDQHDVTFGCAKKTEQAFDELMRECKPDAVYIVTTCVPEIIGDDFDAVAYSLQEKYNIPVMAVHTEHFKCNNHLPGIERTLTASFSMMEMCEKKNSVNIIGQRMGNFSDTEVYRVLKNANIDISAMIPSGITVDEIKHAPQARVNIVVHELGLALAKKMQSKFGIPYILFDKFTNPIRIEQAYKTLFEFLQVDYPEELVKLKERAIVAMTEAKDMLQGVSFIYGNTPFRCLESNSFMCELGMIPQLIQCHTITEDDNEDIHIILKHADPYITQPANIAPLQYMYDELKPTLYLGHEYAMRLRKKGIAIVHTDRAGSMLGFEVTNFFVQQLIASYQEAMNIQKELSA